jgi:RHS repeat-associated protein
VGGLGYKDETAATGLYYLRQRYYSPDLGRFLSRDPLGFDSDFNLYAYAGNSPVVFVDPEGMKFVYDPSLKNNEQKAKYWIKALMTTPGPLQNTACALDADPRSITIRAANLRPGVPAKTTIIPPKPGVKPGDKNFAAQGAYLDIDFSQLASKSIQTKCGGKSVVVAGHELGHVDLAFTLYKLFIILGKANAMAGSHPDLFFKGLPFDELYTVIKYEDPLRKSLGVPPVLSPQESTEGMKYMKTKGIPLP